MDELYDEPAAKIAILGASRGLGRALAKEIGLQAIQAQSEIQLFLVARREEALREIVRANDQYLGADFTKAEDQTRVIVALHEFRPDVIYYVAGGGPFGLFEKKAWKDHAWAMELNFNFPARLLHTVLADGDGDAFLRQFVWIGSKIAGHNPDPQAASYAAAKHAARGLIGSLQKEATRSIDIALYEPGYMATDLLPANAWPRQQGLAKAVEDEARELYQWSRSRLK